MFIYDYRYIAATCYLRFEGIRLQCLQKIRAPDSWFLLEAYELQPSAAPSSASAARLGWANKVLLRLARYFRDEREHVLGSDELLLTSSSVLTRTFCPDKCPYIRSDPPRRCLSGHSVRVNVRLFTMSPRTAGKGRNRFFSQAQAPQNVPSDAVQSLPQRPWPWHIRQILPCRGRQATASPSVPTCSGP